jgi:prepilin-type N-terminal cleavage/methylation domain-containing protein
MNLNFLPRTVLCPEPELSTVRDPILLCPVSCFCSGTGSFTLVWDSGTGLCYNYFNMSNQNSKSFTLIELLIVLAIIAILATILILTIKPGLIFSKARDTKRINDLKNIEKIMDAIYTIEYTFNELNYASSNVVCISLPDNNTNCSN